MGVNSLTRDTLNSTVKYTSAQAGNSVYDVSAMEPIASVTLMSNGYVEFTSIPQNYQDLYLVVNARAVTTSGDSGTSNQALTDMYFNDVTTNYSNRFLIGDGSSATSPTATNQTNCYLGYIPNGSATTGALGSVVAHVLNYTNTSVFKTVLSRSASDVNGSGRSVLAVNLWRNTAAITKTTVYCSSTNFTAGSTVTLYGIKAVGQ